MKQAADSIEYRVGEPMPGTKWVVRGKLGQGGMGVVLDVVKAHFIKGAMKVLLPSFAKMPEFAARFLDEVKVTAQLQHPNIVQVLDFDRLADGTPFMVMERLRGRTLRAALRETRARGKRWTPSNTYAVAAQVCEGLSRAHSHALSIVHRDVKPDNIFLHRSDGSLDSVVKVMDFGVAAVVGQRDRNQIGTPRYMAPEQVRGDRVSPQTDQYGLALLVYEMLTGRLPWDVDVRNVSAMAEAHLRVAPLPPSKFCAWLPERVDAAILKALSKDPDARHQSVHGLVYELRPLHGAERSSTGESDGHATDPMVGTLADGDPAVREEPDTLARMSLPPLEDLVASVPDVGDEPGISVQFSEAPGAAPAHVLGEPLGEVHGYGQDPPDGSDETTGLHVRGADARARAGPQAAETPMTGESSHGSESARDGDRSGGVLLRKGALGLLVSAAGLAALVTVATMHAVRPPSESPPLSEAAGKGHSVGEHALPTGERMDMQEPAVVAAPPVPPEAPPPTASMPSHAGKAQGDRGAWAPAAAKAVAPAQARARGDAPAKSHVPDDGRDELYVPGAPWGVAPAQARARGAAPAKSHVPDDGRDELYVPGAP